jgi:hypothetical protein
VTEAVTAAPAAAGQATRPRARPVVFLGPTLPVAEARAVLDAEYLPPAQLGDVWRVSQERPSAIGLVDGYFDSVPAVWHKEVLYALSTGIAVYGAASMGALRSAELVPFGMVGVGAIAEAFRSGELTRDDEVALAHADAEHGYLGFSEPLVNVRATLSAAVAAGVVARADADAVLALAASLFYPDRRWEHLLDAGAVGPEAVAALRAWLPAGKVDQKAADARALLARMRDDAARPAPAGAAAGAPAHVFTPTMLWAELVRHETPVAAIVEEFLLVDPLDPAVADAVARSANGGRVDWLAVLRELPAWPERCRRARHKAQALAAAAAPTTDGPGTDDDLLAWFFGERLGWPADLEGFLRRRAWADPQAVLAIARREAAFVGRPLAPGAGR